MPITHCIFDLDGLLLDTESLYTKNTQRILDEFHVPFKHEWKSRMMGAKPHEAAEYLVRESRIALTPSEFSERLYRLMDTDFKTCRLMRGAHALLDALSARHVPMAIATGSSQDSYVAKMQSHADLEPYFSHVVCGGSDSAVKRGKPHPDIFVEAIRRFGDAGIRAENVLVFEDSINGVDAAISAGCRVVWVPERRPGDGAPRYSGDNGERVITLSSLEDFDFNVLN